MAETEGAKFWLSVLTELQTRGLKDIFIAAVDGLTGFPEAINTVYPLTKIQLCIVHMVRNSLKFVSWKDRKAAKNRKVFPHDQAAMKVVYLAIDAAAKKWTMPIRNWKGALNRFMIEFPERMPETL